MEPVFLPADPSIAKAQLETLNKALFFFTSVRNDKYSTEQQKISDMRSAANLSMTDEAYTAILELEEEDWQAITRESNRVLELVLRDSIRTTDRPHALQTIIDFAFKRSTWLITMIVSPLIVDQPV